MGAFGLIYHGARAIYGMATHDYDLVDSSLEKSKRSLYMSVVDPIGVVDAGDVISSVIEDSTS